MPIPALHRKGDSMDLILSFIHPTRSARTLGPFKTIWIDRESLRDGADGPVLARHRHHQWEIDGQSYYRLDCTARVRVSFTGGKAPPPREFGPFNRFSAVDGLAYTDDKVFAVLDEKVSAWFCYDAGNHWPTMVISEARRARGAP